jgi:hypothetical protein
MKLAFFLLMVVVGCSCAQAVPRLVTWEEISGQPAPPADLRTAYGEGALRFGDLQLPTGTGPSPVAVVIHGGCWRSENDLRHVSHLRRRAHEGGRGDMDDRVPPDRGFRGRLARHIRRCGGATVQREVLALFAP